MTALRMTPLGAARRPLAALVATLLLVVRPAGAQPPRPGSGTVAGTVTEAGSTQTVAGATIQVTGGGQVTASRSDGRYRLVLPAGQYELVARLIGFGSVRRLVTVTAGQTTMQDFALDAAALNLQQVAVVGSRRRERTVTESPVPIDVISAEEIKQTGRTEVGQILQMLVPSLNFSRATVADGTDHQRPFTLRGMGPDQVLVLLNGKRRHTGALVNINNSIGRGSAGVDLNAIPASAIDRIEVLRDGAAAQYGSDAIAGVVNIVLKRTAPFDLSTTLGQTQAGDGQVVQADLSRSLTFGDQGFLTFSAEYRNRGFTNRSLPDLRPQYGDSVTLTAGQFAVTPNSRAADGARRNLVNHRQGDAATQDAVLFANAGTTVGSVELYAVGGLSRRQGEAAGFFRRAGDTRTSRFLFPDGFLPLIATTIWDQSLTAGARGRTAGWSWDASSTYGANSFRFDARNTNNASLGNVLANRAGGATVCYDAGAAGTLAPRQNGLLPCGAAPPTAFYAGTLRFTQVTTTVDASRGFAVGLAAPLTVAVGAEHRYERYGIAAGEPYSWIDGGALVRDNGRSTFTLADSLLRAAPGAQVFPGFRPQDARLETRTAVAAYVDLETKPTARWLVSAAGRAERFSDFGAAVTAKLATRLELDRAWAVRGSFNTGFRAPSLAQSHLSAASTNFIGNPPVPQEVLTLPVASPAARALGATDLSPERSTNLTLGVTWAPAPAFSATLDAFRIAIDDRVVFSENLLGQAVTDRLAALGFRGQTSARFFTNAIDTETNGLDLVTRYGAQLEDGSTLRVTWGTSWNRTFVTRIAPNPPQLAALAATVFGRVERNRVEETQPRLSSRVGVNFQKKQLGLEVQHAYFGGITLRQGAAVNNAGQPIPLVTQQQADQRMPGRWITDVSASWRFSSDVTLTGGFDNVFNVYPERNLPINSNSGIFQYSGFSPFGFNGRFGYVRLSYRM
jgi:iron complex outermembrane receptor protein